MSCSLRFIETKDREHLVVAGLNVKNEPTVIQVVHIGTINQSLAFPRDILKMALLSNSVSICVGHNHPSGSVTASLADIEFTAKLEKACRLLQINLQDHLIISSGGKFLSMKAEGYITNNKYILIPQLHSIVQKKDVETKIRVFKRTYEINLRVF